MYIFCKWYIQMWLKFNKYNTLEIVIRNDGNTIRKRNFEREEIIKNVLDKIK